MNVFKKLWLAVDMLATGPSPKSGAIEDTPRPCPPPAAAAGSAEQAAGLEFSAILGLRGL